jgi:hypothetical protein
MVGFRGMSTKVDEIICSISGLNPESVLVLSPGFVREEWKSLCFKREKSLIATAIQSPKQIAQLFVPELNERMLDQGARIEMLRENFKSSELKSGLPKLMEHRFRPKFFESLARALEKGRELFVHSKEAGIFQERLDEKNGRNERRTEFFLLNQFWEHLLSARDFADDARLFELASERLRAGHVQQPAFRKIYWLHHFPMSPRVRFFCESLAQAFQVEMIHSSEFFKGESKPIERVIAHSMEDGAQHLFDDLLTSGNLDRDIVVIEDRPEVRRTLHRIAAERGLPLKDARDPTLLSHAEEVKNALLELEMVSKGFPRDLVLAWVGVRSPGRGDIRRKIIESNETQGMEAYAFDPLLQEALKKVEARYSKRMKIAELKIAIEASVKSFELPGWVLKTISSQIEDWEQSLLMIGLAGKARPIRFWHKELQEQMKKAAPPVPPVRFGSGLRIYRVDQAVSFSLPADVKIHFFGVSTSFLEPREESTEWLSGRDLETLALEFSLPDRRAKREAIRGALESWVSRSSESCLFWECLYDEDGTEQEPAELSLRSFAKFELGEPRMLPVHPLILPSLTAKLSPSVSTARVEVAQREFPLSFLNALGNCAFTAYSQYLLKLYDERDPDFEIGNDIYGNLIHAAVEILVQKKWEPSSEEAFAEAWKKTRKPAWVRSERLRRAMQKRVMVILDRFRVSDLEFQAKSGTDTKVQEQAIELKREGFVLQGRMDRVDQHADGLVVFDYKTGAKLPSGQSTLEKGKGLQLPAYALALRDQENQDVVSAQYIQMNPDKINRNYGILFKKWNKGKAADEVEFPLSFVKSNHTSLFSEEPEMIWKAFDEKISSLLKKVKEGEFMAAPADEADCNRCRYSGVCGRGRAVLP